MRTEPLSRTFDAVVIGGSYAGLSAAMQLARARRRVLVVDAGKRRNRFAGSSHGFLGHDGRAPAAIVQDGRDQLLAYPDADWLDDMALRAAPTPDGFAIETATGVEVRARQLVLATGVVDELPDVAGLAARWGKHVFHCPYCHGFELNRGHIGVLAVGPMSLHQATMLPDWGAVTLFTNGALELDERERQLLAQRGVRIETAAVIEIVDAATIVLADRRRVVLDGLFTVSRTRMASPLAEQLGCAFEDGPMGPYIATDGTRQTTVTGVFACGDAARAAGNVAFAVADGAQAGIAAHRALLFG